MTNRIYNFTAGPAVLPVEVLEEARDNMLSLGETGIGIMEHSHRGKAYMAIHEETEALCRELAGIPDNFHVLFLQGGASLQFSMVPMNFLRADQTADYLITGAWSQKAAIEAERCGKVHVAGSSEDRNFSYIPKSCVWSDSPAYAHFTSNNTIFGTQFAKAPDAPPGVPLICDASSDIFSRPLEMSKYAMIYAGAQKNLGPSGVTLVIIRDDLVERGPKDLGTMLQYRTYADDHSLYNTPPTFGIYVMGLVFKWIKKQGGLAAVERVNRDKAQKLYRHLDSGGLFRPTADADSRSMMNVTFVTGDSALDEKFISTAKKAGLDGLKGHRSVGGMRASLYNAFPPAGVDALLEVMRDFESKSK
jgi:phosphoserine aminotransferase